MGIVISIIMCVSISPITTTLYLCLNKRKSICVIYIFSFISILLSALQYNYSNAFKYFDMIPMWLIIATGLSYALLFSSLIRYILV